MDIKKGIRGLSRRYMLRVRLNDAEQGAAMAAAALAGLTLSAWTRMVIRETASARLKSAGKEAGL